MKLHKNSDAKFSIGLFLAASFLMPLLALVFPLQLAGLRTLAEEQGCAVTQITFSTGEHRVGPGTAINAGGTRIAIESRSDLTGDNADLNDEIFIFDTNTNALTQITDSVGEGGSALPSLSANGTRLVFVSNGDFLGTNADRNYEGFLFDFNAGTFTQFTNHSGITGGPIFPKISADGRFVVFDSSADLTGNNADGNIEVFLYDVAGGSTVQLTATTGGSGIPNPDIDADGSRIVFSADRDLTGENADLESEVFLYDTNQGVLSQVTNSPAGKSSSGATVDDSGTRIAFWSNADHTGGNSDGNLEVFFLDMTSDSLTQITDSVGGLGSLGRISYGGHHIVFSSGQNLTGGNADGSLEFFLVNTATNKITQVSSWPNVSGSLAFASVNADGTRVVFGSSIQDGADNPDGNLEYFLAACDDGDSDDDGIPNDSDPDTVADAVITFPESHFNSAGNKNALLGRLETIEQLILAGDTAQAIKELQNLRKRVDGCGSAADTNDWITNCASQVEVRQLIDTLITNLSA